MGGMGYSASSGATGGQIGTGKNGFGSTWGNINNSLPWYVWGVFALLIVALIVVMVVLK